MQYPIGRRSTEMDSAFISAIHSFLIVFRWENDQILCKFFPYVLIRVQEGLLRHLGRPLLLGLPCGLYIQVEPCGFFSLGFTQLCRTLWLPNYFALGLGMMLLEHPSYAETSSLAHARSFGRCYFFNSCCSKHFPFRLIGGIKNRISPQSP